VQLEAARDVERQLLEALRADPETLDAAEDAVTQHLAALADALGEGDPLGSSSSGTTASPSPSPTSGATAPLRPLRAADRAADQHMRALRSATAAITPLLASIAASDAAIAAALRSGGR